MCRDQAGLKMKALCFSGTDPQEVQYHPPHPRLPVSSRRYLLAALLGTKNSKKKPGSVQGLKCQHLLAPALPRVPFRFYIWSGQQACWEAGVLLPQMKSPGPQMFSGSQTCFSTLRTQTLGLCVCVKPEQTFLSGKPGSGNRKNFYAFPSEHRDSSGNQEQTHTETHYLPLALIPFHSSQLGYKVWNLIL